MSPPLQHCEGCMPCFTLRQVRSCMHSLDLALSMPALTAAVLAPQGIQGSPAHRLCARQRSGCRCGHAAMQHLMPALSIYIQRM